MRPSSTNIVPNLIIIGAMKAATTSLHSYLHTHPDIFMSSYKEPGYFLVEEDTISKARENLGIAVDSKMQLLEIMSRGYRGERYFGESSTYYTKAPSQGEEAPLNIAKESPHARLIYLLRNPVERIISHCLHTADNVGRKLDINATIFKNFSSMLSISLYYYQIERFLRFLHPSQFLILTTESLQSNAQNTLHEVSTFLDIPTNFQVVATTQQHNQSKSRSQYSDSELLIDPRLFHELIKYILNDVEALATLTGYQFPEWDISPQRWCKTETRAFVFSQRHHNK